MTMPFSYENRGSEFSCGGFPWLNIRLEFLQLIEITSLLLTIDLCVSHGMMQCLPALYMLEAMAGQYSMIKNA